MNERVFDVAILGGGPTGLFGVFYAGMRHMRTLVVDALSELGGQLTALYPEKYVYDVGGFPKILARELDASARPTHRDASLGRFMACHEGFYDPEEFDRGREITVVGRVTGTDHGKVGQFDYAYPHVDASAVYLWPKRPLYVRTPYYYDPWLYGYGPGWGYFGPGWGYWGPPVIIRDRRPDSKPAPTPHGK